MKKKLKEEGRAIIKNIKDLVSLKKMLSCNHNHNPNDNIETAKELIENATLAVLEDCKKFIGLVIN